MRLASLAAAMGVAVLGPLGSGGAAAAPQCLGSNDAPQTYLCLVEVRPPGVGFASKNVTLSQGGCAVVVCWGQITVTGYDAVVTSDRTVVLWSAALGKCFYVGGPAGVSTMPASSATAC